jgi:hypothetical protein
LLLFLFLVFLLLFLLSACSTHTSAFARVVGRDPSDYPSQSGAGGRTCAVDLHSSAHFARRLSPANTSLTIADLALGFTAGALLKGSFDHIPPSYLDQFPLVKDRTIKIQAHPAVVAWETQAAANKAAAAAAAAAGK